MASNIYANVLLDNNLLVGKIIDLSCWGAKIKVDKDMALHHHLKLKFIYKFEYFVEAEVLEKLDSAEYKIKFIFNDLRQNEMLKRDIHRDKHLDCRGVWCRL